MLKPNHRRTLIYWLYAVSIGHILAGIALPLIIHLPLFDDYHRLLAAGFWRSAMPDELRAQQVWWMSLFGATIQNVGIWMAALVRLGDLHRSRFAWLSLLIGVLVWAPQDMWISYTKDVLLHVWVDCFALIVMIPPLLFLAHSDKALPTANSKERPLHNRHERSKFELRSAPVLEHSEHRKLKIRSRSRLCRGLKG